MDCNPKHQDAKLVIKIIKMKIVMKKAKIMLLINLKATKVKATKEKVVV